MISLLSFFFGILLFVLDEHSKVSEERAIHLYMQVNRNFPLRLEAIFVPVTSKHSHFTRHVFSKTDHKQQEMDEEQ